MAIYNKFQVFNGDLGKKIHDLQAAGDTLKAYLTNAIPDAALDTIKTDLAEIANGNGYAAPVDIQNDYSAPAGVGTLTGVDIVITATGGTVGPFRYVAIYNDTPVSPVDPLVAWWDYGSALTLQDGEKFTIDFGASIFTIT